MRNDTNVRGSSILAGVVLLAALLVAGPAPAQLPQDFVVTDLNGNSRPLEDAVLIGAVRIRYNEDPALGVNEVRFFIDGDLIDKVKNSPFETKPFDTTSLTDGPYTFLANVLHPFGQFNLSLNFFVDNASVPGTEAKGLQIVRATPDVAAATLTLVDRP